MKEKKNNKILIVLLLIICLQILCYILTFAIKKEVFHEDEFFSYALSNSSGRPFIYGTKVQVPDNYNSWETGDSFRYYLRTKKGTAFDYVNVWANQKADVHPPLYYALLHTFSSIFPEKFSWWWGFSLNLVFFAVMQVFLFKWSKRFAKSEYGGLLVCIFYGFTLAALNTVMYIRMYEMLTMFIVILVYLGSEAADADKLSFKKHLLPLIFTIFGGALTQHFFLIFAFAFVLLHCFFELCKRKIRNMLAFGTASLIGALLSFVAFPASFKHMFYNYSYNGKIYPDLQSFFAGSILLYETTGYKLSFVHENPLTYITIFLVGSVAIIPPVLFLFRKELSLKTRLLKMPSTFITFLQKSNYTWINSLFSCTVIIWFVVTKIYYYSFFEYYDRFLFMIFPLIIAIAICVPFRVFSCIKIRFISIGFKAIVSVVLVGVLIFQNVYGDRSQYAYQESKSCNGSINSFLIDADCILILSSPIFLPCYSHMMENADDIYISLSLRNIYQEQKEAYQKLFEENDIVFVAFQKDCLQSSVHDNETNDFKEVESFNSHDIYDKLDIKKEMLKSETELTVGEEEMLHFFEYNYNCIAEYCTMEHTHTKPYRVMLYKLITQTSHIENNSAS